MRREALIAGGLALAAALLILASDWLDLELETVAFFGAAVGAVTALIPSGSGPARVGGLLSGFVIGWGGYLLRASQLPDTSAGRAVTVVAVVALCLAVTLATGRRLPLWSVVLGAATFAGAYEFTYNAAPPEILSTSLSTVTSMLLSIGVGWLVVSLLAPEPSPHDRTAADDSDDLSPAADDAATSRSLTGSER